MPIISNSNRVRYIVDKSLIYRSKFKFTVDTTKAGSASDTFVLPLSNDVGSSYNFLVDWGDGSKNLITSYNQAEATHVYSSSGIKNISIIGICIGWSFKNAGDKLKITNITEWGTSFNFWSGGLEYFHGCANLTTLSATDAPYLPIGSSLKYIFSECSQFNSPVSHWDTSNVTDMSSMFRSNTTLNSVFNQDISGWDLSNVTETNSMFQNNTFFNQNIGAWDVSQVTSMFTMFNGATNFNNGGSDSIKNWDTSKVQTMYSMFQSTAFNQPIGIWNVSGVGAMAYMFSGSQFNQDISGWDTSSCTDMSYMLRSCPFNNDISSWNVEKVAIFHDMFSGNTAFRHNVGTWWLRSATNLSDMFSNIDMNVGGSPVNKITTFTQDYTNAVWTKVNSTVTGNTTVAPDGSTTADKIKPSVTNSTDHSVTRTVTVTNGVNKTVRVAFKAIELTYGQLILSNAITGNVYVNLSTGAIESGSGTVYDIGNGWYVLSISGVTSSTSLTIKMKAWDNSLGTSFAGNASDGIALWQSSAFDTSSTSFTNYSNLLTGWIGFVGGVETLTGVTSAAVVSGGANYVVGDVLTIDGGTLGIGTKYAEVKVETIDVSGSVLTVSVKRSCGNYSSQPSGTVATSGGTGLGCTLTLTWATKSSMLPSGKSFNGGISKYSMIDSNTVAAVKYLKTTKTWSITDGGAL